jgi:hypothetical protein
MAALDVNTHARPVVVTYLSQTVDFDFLVTGYFSNVI